jgi:hypothetical protein
MPRGFTWAVYVDDSAQPWAIQVDSDYILDPGRGWTDFDPTGLTPYPRGWRPRKAIGIEANGRHHRAVIASVTADIWTGVITVFTIRANDGFTAQCQVVSTLEERRTIPAPDVIP